MENETGYLPPLKTKIDSIQNYDLVFVGFPTWGMKLPPPMKSFLKQYDLGGKTVVPFNTNDGYGIGSSFDTVKELCPNSKMMDGFTIKGGVESDGQPRLSKDANAKRMCIIKMLIVTLDLYIVITLLLVLLLIIYSF